MYEVKYCGHATALVGTVCRAMGGSHSAQQVALGCLLGSACGMWVACLTHCPFPTLVVGTLYTCATIGLWQPDRLGVLFYSAGRVQHLLVVASSRNRNEYLLVVLHSAGCVERAQNDRRTVLCDA